VLAGLPGVGYAQPLTQTAGPEVGQAEHVPWSGWWWPLWDQQNPNLYDAGGPMAKYDAYVAATTGSNPGAQRWESINHKVPDTDPNRDWRGHCQAWSLVSLLEPEPQPITKAGVALSRNDFEGMLTEAYYFPTGQFWGTRYNPGGTPESLEDIYPADFDRVVRYYLGEQRQGLVMEIFSTEAVWNYPAYRYERTATTAGGVESVTLKVWLADAKSDVAGTVPLIKTYTYTLQTGTNGAWTGGSVADHPDYIWLPTGRNAPENPAIDYTKIQQAMQQDDQRVQEGYPDRRVLKAGGNTHAWKNTLFEVTNPFVLTQVGFYKTGPGSQWELRRSDAAGTLGAVLASGTLIDRPDNDFYYRNIAPLGLDTGRYVFRVYATQTYYSGPAAQTNPDFTVLSWSAGANPATTGPGGYAFRLGYTLGRTVKQEAYPDHRLIRPYGNLFQWKNTLINVTQPLALTGVGFYNTGNGMKWEIRRSDAAGVLGSVVGTGTLGPKDTDNYFQQALDLLRLDPGYYVVRVYVTAGTYYAADVAATPPAFQVLRWGTGDVAVKAGPGGFAFRLSYTR